VNRVSCCALVAPLFAIACAQGEEAAPVNSAPVASLSCPERAEPNESFHVKGTVEDVDGDEIGAQSIQQGANTVDGAEADLTVAFDGIAVVTYLVSDARGAAATAACRVVIGTGIAPVAPIGGEGEGEPAGGPVDLNGTFAEISYDLSSLSNVILNPGTQCASEPVLSLVRFAQEGTHITQTKELCAIDFATVNVHWVGPSETVVPDAFVSALSDAMSTPIEIELTGATAGSLYSVPPQDPVVLGAVNDDGEAVDSDGDDNPGATLGTSWGDQWVTYTRHVLEQRGLVTSSNEIDGSAPGSITVDSSSQMVTSFENVFMPTGAGLPSVFKMMRVDGANDSEDIANLDGDPELTCEDVKLHRAALEAALPAPTCD
jgi:hypothetical protein